MIAIGYTRRSKKSEANTVSLETQRSQIDDYCRRQGLDLQYVVTDDGVSGTKRKRFEAIQIAVDTYKPAALVVYHLDRLARDSAGLMDYLTALTKRGIALHEVAGGGAVDNKRAIGRMVTGIRGVTDQFYAEMIGEKTADALALLRAGKLRYSNIAPLGYLYIDGKMIADAEEQHALEVLKRCRAAGLGARRALYVLEAGGYRGRKSLNVIHKALKRDD
jgi:DNA invertase Pin-like site-specific DNA recombinase